MPLDVISPLPHIPQSFRPVSDQKLLDQVLGDRVHVLGPLYPPAEYLLVNSERIVVEERWKPSQHLVNQNPERPPIHRFIVSFALDYFWRQVLGRPAQSPCSTNAMTDRNT